MVRPGRATSTSTGPSSTSWPGWSQDARALTDQPPGGLRLTRQAHGAAGRRRTRSGRPRVSWPSGRPHRPGCDGWSKRGAAAGPPRCRPGCDATLRPYQQDGFQWLDFLRRYGLGGVLADDMGLGKTRADAGHDRAGAQEDRPVRAAVPGRRPVQRGRHLAGRSGPVHPGAAGRRRSPSRRRGGAGRWPPCVDPTDRPTSWSPRTRCCGWRSSSTPPSAGPGWSWTRRRW